MRHSGGPVAPRKALEKQQRESRQKKAGLPTLMGAKRKTASVKVIPKSALKKPRLHSPNIFLPPAADEPPAQPTRPAVPLRGSPASNAQTPTAVARLLPTILGIVRDNVVLITKRELFEMIAFDPNEESVYRINLDEDPGRPKEVLADLDA